MKKKIISVILSVIMSISYIPASVCSAENRDIAVGDYISLGRYYDEPIIWRCVAIDDNGPLMLSDKILCFKPFDAKGNHGNYLRDKEGTNNWNNSCLRYWLNSAEIDWLNRAAIPNEQSCFNGYNAYSDEKGFLCSFSDEELAMIKTVTQKTYINEIDREQADGGNGEYAPPFGKFATVLNDKAQNHTGKMYQDTTDKIFLLDITQVQEVYKNLGAKYLLADATETAKNNDTSEENFDAECYHYWLRSPGTSGMSYECVLVVAPDEQITHMSAFSVLNATEYHSVGVRPAFYLNLENWDGDVMKHGETYAETHGWCLLNNSKSFGFDTNDTLTMLKYLTEHYNGITNLASELLNTIPVVNGQCYGMSLLSLAQYYGHIDLSDYFNNPTGNLYDFGYDHIYKNRDGEECFSVAGNDDVSELIINAQYSQFASPLLSKYEMFVDDYDFSELLTFFNSDEAKPIMLTMNSSKGKHAMVLTPDVKPIALEGDHSGWYVLSVYDPNAPANSEKLQNPMEQYLREDACFMVNPTTSSWSYYVAGATQYYELYYGLFNNQNVRFYDISQVPPDFFSFIETYSYGKTRVCFWTENFVMHGANGEVLLEISEGIVKKIVDDAVVHKMIDDAAGMTGWVFFTDDSHITISTSDDAECFVLSDEYMFISHLDKSYSASIDTQAGKMCASFSNFGKEATMCIQDFTNNSCIKITGNGRNGECLSLSLSEKCANVTSNYNNESVLCEYENLDSDDVHISIPNEKENIDGNEIISETPEQKEETDNSLNKMSKWVIVLVVGSFLFILCVVAVFAFKKGTRRKHDD